MPKITKEDIEDKIKSLTRERNKLIIELNKIQEELSNQMESYYLTKPDTYTKIFCIGCNGVGYIKEGEKKVLCKVCGGKQYNWVIKYKEGGNAGTRQEELDDSGIDSS